MPKIEKVSWGKVTIDGRKYHQVLIIGDNVEERDSGQLRKLFRTTHWIGDWEQKKLLSGNPDVVLVAHGFNGVLKVDKDFEKKLREENIDFEVVLTPKVVQEYHALIKNGKKVNALIHTTC